MPLFTSPSETSPPYNPTLWALQNPWFRNHSELTGALGEQKPDQEAPTSRPALSSSCAPELHQERGHTPVPCGGFGGSPAQYTPKVTAQFVGQVLFPEPSTYAKVFEYGHGWGGGNDEYYDLWAVADLHEEEATFCRVGNCRYWHTDPRQVRRHRDTHFEHRFGFECPNQFTCPSRGSSFRRRDAVSAHCKRSLPCGEALKANQGEIQYWGTPATEEDLRPRNPQFDIPYVRSDGRTRRGKVARFC